MAVAGMPHGSLRLERAESSRLAWAFAISLALHLLVLGTYYTGKKLNVWQNLHWPAWLQPVKTLVERFKKKDSPQRQQQQPPQEAPLMFVDVSPAQATAEPPKNAQFYSSKNSQAANPEANKDTNVPQITGTQTEVVKTEDVPREKFTPLQPTRPPQPPQPAQPAPQEQEEMKAKPSVAPGDLTMAKPDQAPKKGEGEAPRSRPRRLAEVQSRQQDNRLPGQKMKQEGGVKRRLEISSLDAKATPFGRYDDALVSAICQCWYSLLDDQGYASDYRGKVVLRFHLHADGRVTDLAVVENTAGSMAGLLCQTAVDKPNPYPPFPGDMRRIVGEIRSIQFTFYYN